MGADRILCRIKWTDKPVAMKIKNWDLVELELPITIQEPTTWIVTDLFHDLVSDKDVDRILAVMALTPRHTYQVLTERPERRSAYFSKMDRCEGSHVPVRVAEAARKILESRGGIELLESRWQDYLAINRSFPLSNLLL